MPERWRGASRPEELVEQVLTAKVFYEKGKQYVVQQKKVIIVDEFTGRIMQNRKWRHGLHQAIEAKEGARLIGKFVSWRVQRKARKLAVLSRKSVLKMDAWLDEEIGFSGNSLC